MNVVDLRAGELSIQAQALSSEPQVSRHSGKELACYTVRFQVHDNRRPQVEQALSSGIGELMHNSGDESKSIPVRIAQKEWSYTEGRPVTTYVWVLTQEEELKLDTLIVGDVELKPYWYKEEIDHDEVLTIEARVKLDDATERALRNQRGYFTVVRKGISDEKKTMRFSSVIWSSDDDYTEFKMDLMLVEKSFDEKNKSRGFLQPQFSNMRDMVAVTSVRIGKLLELLKSKNVFTEEEIETISIVADKDVMSQRFEMDRVDDLDEWLKAREE